MQYIVNTLLSRIYGKGRGWVFSSSDFTDIFNREQVDNALFYLAKREKIRRISRGMYDYPKYSNLLNRPLSPDIHQVAQAYARKFNWRIIPTGDAVLNLMGISTQVPGRFLYISDGPNRKYKIGNQKLEFKKSALKNFGFKYTESGLIVQALKAIGREKLTDELLIKIRNNIDLSRHKEVINDTKFVTTWIHEYIKKIYLEA